MTANLQANGTHASQPTRILVWQWGRNGGAPRFAAQLATGLSRLPNTLVHLSLAQGAAILQTKSPPNCDLPIKTYNGLGGFFARVACTPFEIPSLTRRIAALQPDFAICAMPGPLDLMMVAALRRLARSFVVILHDATPHPGDGLPGQMAIQRIICGQADAVATLSNHVSGQFIARKRATGEHQPLIRLWHPPFDFDFQNTEKPADGIFRLLMFGRLLRYKGLDLLLAALRLVGPRPDLLVRVVGAGPDSIELDDLRGISGVTVENRWVPEDEIGALFGWCDGVILPYQEASQSGVASIALAAGKHIVATRVGGLGEQLADNPLASLCEPEAGQLAVAIGDLLKPHPPAAIPTIRKDGWTAMGRSLVDQAVEALNLRH